MKKNAINAIDTRWKLNNGNSIPLLGFGTWKSTGNDAENSVFEALKIGYRHIDTARIYGNEERVGKAIKKAMSELGIKREEIFVTTKLWNDDHGDVRAALEESLRKLGLDYVDLYLIHWPVEVREKSWETLEQLYKEGKCKSIGVSNFTIKHLTEFLKKTKTVPVVNQVEFTPYLYQKELLEFCGKNNIILEAYSPLTRGQRLEDADLILIATKYNKTTAQVLLRWCLQHGVIPLPKSITKSRIAENANIFDFTISKEDMEKLDSLNEDLRFCWNPSEMP